MIAWRRLSLAALATVALACGEDEPPPEPSGPPPVSSLDTIDLCGGENDTAALVREQLVEGGTRGVVRYFRERVSLPANVRTCRAVQAEPQLHERVLRLQIHRMTPEGTRLESLLELGAPLAVLPLGVVTEELTAYPDDPSQPNAEGVRLTLSSQPD